MSEIDFTQANTAIQRAVAVALISVGLTVIAMLGSMVTDIPFLQVNPLAFIDIALMLGLAFGVHKKSRICAVLLLVYSVAGHLNAWLAMGNVATLPAALLFSYFYIQGMRGTFAYHHFLKLVDPSDSEEKRSAERVERSGYSLVSLALGIMNVVVILMSIALFAGAEHTTAVQIIVGLLFVASVLMSPVGFTFGIVAFIRKHRYHMLSLLGFIVNGLFSVLHIIAFILV